MRSPTASPAPDQRGFMLVGVVMFMLALTILGLSLFSLSSYEAQFFTVSASREQSLQNAESGMELVKALLQMQPQRLENAQLAVGQFGIRRALAYQWRSPLASDTTSRGNVNWDSTMVVVITAGSGGVERTVQSRYLPVPGESPYRKLLTAGRSIQYNMENWPPPQSFELRGEVWQSAASSADTAWTRLVNWATGRPLRTTPPPSPLADAFVDAKYPSASSPTYWSGDHGPYSMKLINAGSTPKYFRSPASPHDAHHAPEYDDYSFYVNDDLTLSVRGTAVWVVPRGACFRNRVTVVQEDNSVPSTLVIVAKANGRSTGYANRALWFQGGLRASSAGMRVFLVSQADIGLTHRNEATWGPDVNELCILAGGSIELGGPASGYRQRIMRDAATMDPVVDQLVASGALPGLTASSTMAFSPIRSTWLETTPR